MTKEELLARGWDTWYNDDYWVHTKTVADPARQDHTNYGMSFEEAVKWEQENKKPIPAGYDLGSAFQVLKVLDKAIAATSAELTGEIMKTGIELIIKERQRQIEVEGWTPEHDAEHKDGALSLAAVCYAYPPPRPLEIKMLWPWDWDWWKPTAPEITEHFHGREQAGDPIPISISDEAWKVARIRDLTKAGALIAAEIDRLQSQPQASSASEPDADKPK